MQGKAWMFSHLIDDEDLVFWNMNLSVIDRQWSIISWDINRLFDFLIYPDLCIKLVRKF